MTSCDTAVARCVGCDAQFHYVSQKNKTLSCGRCGAPLIVREPVAEIGTLLQSIARSAVFPPAPLRLPRWRIA